MAATSSGTPSSKIKRGEIFAVQCPSRTILKDVTSRWGMLVLVALREGTLRFSDLRRKIGGVSEKMLSQTLRRLERDGLVERTVHPVIPPHVDYTLTALGEGIGKHIETLTDWIEVNLPKIMKAQQNKG